MEYSISLHILRFGAVWWCRGIPGASKGVGCELRARPHRSPCSRRSQRPLGVARRARIPKSPRVASHATPPVGAEEGLGGRCDRFFGSARVTERPARQETRYKFTPMCPSSAEGLVGTLILDTIVARSRISNLESRISNLGAPEMGLSTLYGTSRPPSHPLPQRTSLEISTSTLEM